MNFASLLHNFEISIVKSCDNSYQNFCIRIITEIVIMSFIVIPSLGVGPFQTKRKSAFKGVL